MQYYREVARTFNESYCSPALRHNYKWIMGMQHPVMQQSEDERHPAIAFDPLQTTCSTHTQLVKPPLDYMCHIESN